tara:strand:- start:890 stop:1603 length:714 start_codon:yes stop_codon:yes gene_type:complete
MGWLRKKLKKAGKKLKKFFSSKLGKAIGLIGLGIMIPNAMQALVNRGRIPRIGEFFGMTPEKTGLYSSATETVVPESIRQAEQRAVEALQNTAKKSYNINPSLTDGVEEIINNNELISAKPVMSELEDKAIEEATDNALKGVASFAKDTAKSAGTSLLVNELMPSGDEELSGKGIVHPMPSNTMSSNAGVIMQQLNAQYISNGGQPINFEMYNKNLVPMYGTHSPNGLNSQWYDAKL